MRKILLLLLSTFVFSAFGIAGSKTPVTIFLMGDETMADNMNLDMTLQRGWGQVLPSYLAGNIVVQNFAKPGNSVKKILDNGSWTQLLVNVKRGDVVILQFGNNDRIKNDTSAFSSIENLETKLMEIVDDVQKANANIILCTPIAQNVFYDGKACHRMGGYSEAVRRVAQRKEVVLVDAERLTETWLEEIGEEAARTFFTEDKIMLNEEGALEVSKRIAEDIQKKNLRWFGYVNISETTEVRYTNSVKEPTEN